MQCLELFCCRVPNVRPELVTIVLPSVLGLGLVSPGTRTSGCAGLERHVTVAMGLACSIGLGYMLDVEGKEC